MKSVVSIEGLDEIDVDGQIDSQGVRYFGKAKWDGEKWVALAAVDGCLCWVECSVTISKSTLGAAK